MPLCTCSTPSTRKRGFSLADADGGTEIDAVHDGLPPGVSPEENGEGWRSSLEKLAALAEQEWP